MQNMLTARIIVGECSPRIVLWNTSLVTYMTILLSKAVVGVILCCEILFR